MAQVTPDVDLQEHIDYLIGVVTQQWQDVPYHDAEWRSWSPDDRFEALVEWGIAESRFAELQEYADEGLLTPTQRERYDELLRLIPSYRPVIERLKRLVDD